MNNAELSCWSILTTKKDICRFISINEYSIVHQTVLCMLWDNDDPCYKTSMVALCVRLQTLNYMCFRSRSGPQKMSAREYNHLLFDGLLETQQEFTELIREKKPLTSYSQCRLDTLWIKLTRIRELWCNMIAMPYDRPFLPELIFAFEYVMQHDPLPAPVYSNLDMMITPINYPGYEICTSFENDYPHCEAGGPGDGYPPEMRNRK